MLYIYQRKNQDKIDWYSLLVNTNAIDLLENNIDKWSKDECHILSGNPNAIPLLEKHQDKIYWSWFSKNPSIFELDYDALKERCYIYKEELVKKVFHPSKLEKLLDMGISIDELDDCI